ncbi:MAG: phosphodiester glycosidase family protein [Bacilli bacterium]|nr:phosphodiester glycosidase family protein [Bacilli bacterium]MDD4809268.1 phosphodiester glycosidase family protein [Bacilli bacterium]
MKKTIITLLVLDFLALIGFFITYGPWGYFRDLLVTTAMNTMTHNYLARIFYNDEMIKDILSRNYIIEVNETTNVNEIVVGNIKETKNYSSIYEKQILEREEGQSYKVIEFKYKGYDYFLTAIYDPSRVELASTRYLGVVGEYVTDIAKNNDALVAINAGGFYDGHYAGNGGTPTGVVIQGGKIIFNGTYIHGNIVGFNQDDILVLSKGSIQGAVNAGIRDAVQFGPFLIVNGKASSVGGNGGGGMHPRTAIAQRKDGIVLFLVVDGNGDKYNFNLRGGASYGDLITILQRYGAYNAANMDGGASTVLAIEGKLVNKPCGQNTVDGQRKLPNAWIMK